MHFVKTSHYLKRDNLTNTKQIGVCILANNTIKCWYTLKNSTSKKPQIVLISLDTRESIFIRYCFVFSLQGDSWVCKTKTSFSAPVTVICFVNPAVCKTIRISTLPWTSKKYNYVRCCDFQWFQEFSSHIFKFSSDFLHA